MGFQDNIPGIHVRAHNQIGVSGMYYPVVDDPIITEPTDCKLIINHDVELGPSGFESEIVEMGITVEALYSVVGSPKKGSYFVIDVSGVEKTYTVKRTESNDRVFVVVVVNES